ncbi:beta-ketoacyl-[acyl-carrier-protein] synthase family protein [Streptomyces corynorhini]|uniref:3-oxoacyl-ACP synthase n=1 Tax=Streptomyces corynorhini TaxID=2282652 RepID=A0A370B477_9ACTN|nr:hypothetical protein [Streptomyces corynorhini]RDG36608.1 hypothetical protein DVH02_19155 [Streptomyces corynorhini]
MGTVITAARVAAPAPGPAAATTVRLAGEAARDCLERARVSTDAVGVLINVGVYRERNTIEPSMAALVQKEAGIHLDYHQRTGPTATFSFDLMNGACGVLNAVQVSGALLAGGSTERVLVTAADAHPGGRADQDPDYPYADLGAALLLERSPIPEEGFGPVRQRGARGPAGGAGFLDMAAMGSEGRRRITVRRDQDWEPRLLDLTVDTVTGYVRDEGLELPRTLLVCNRPTPGFTAALAGRLGLAPDAVIAPEAPDAAEGVPHTAAPVLGYLRAVEGGLPEGYDQLLIVSAGAGLTAACVSYRPRGR